MDVQYCFLIDRRRVSGFKFIDKPLRNITMYQMGYNSTHSATVTIDGNYATNFFMNQNNGYSSSSYTLNNFCNTSTGCNITVND